MSINKYLIFTSIMILQQALNEINLIVSNYRVIAVLSFSIIIKVLVQVLPLLCSVTST